jgi:hypothetical protein
VSSSALGDAVALLIGIAVLTYLIWTLLFPERF